MLKIVEAALERAERRPDQVLNSGSGESWMKGGGLGEDMLACGSCQGGRWQAFGLPVVTWQRNRKTAVSVAHALEILALVSFSKNPLS